MPDIVVSRTLKAAYDAAMSPKRADIQEDMPGYYSTHVAVDREASRYDYTVAFDALHGVMRIMTSDEPHMVQLPAAVVDAIVQLRAHAESRRHVEEPADVATE